MKFQVEWQVIVYDDFDRLKDTKNGQSFEIQTSSFEKGREIAEKEATHHISQEQRLRPSSDFLVAKVVALINEAGIRYQLQER